jgi:alcohol dehydrogenase class IV
MMRSTEIAAAAAIARRGSYSRDIADRTTAPSNALIARLENLIAELGLPSKFHEVGISRQYLCAVARSCSEWEALLVIGHPASKNQVISLLEMGLCP